MNKLLTLFSALCLMASCVGAAEAQQTPLNTECSDESALSWDVNPEPDVDHYNVYAANNPIDPLADNTSLLLLQVPHPPPGSVQVVHPLNSNLSEGDKYFRVTAVDTVANESGLSIESGCHYNLVPGVPGNVQIIIKLAP